MDVDLVMLWLLNILPWNLIKELKENAQKITSLNSLVKLYLPQ